MTPPLKSGRDTHVLLAKPKGNYGSAKYVLLRSGKARALLSFPGLQALVRGKTVASAILRPKVRGAWPNTNVTVAPVVKGWAAGAVTWDNQPDLRGTATASAASGAVADGGRFGIPVTNLVSAIAAGAADYGWRITVGTDADRYVHGFESGSADGAWILEVTLVEPAEPPSAMTPSGGSIGVPKWVCTLDDSDLGDGETSVAAIRVQVDAEEDEASPDYDTGWVPVLEAELDLATTSYPGLASDASTVWRGQLRDSGGQETAFSDWSDTLTYRPHATATITSPSGATVTTPTPVLEASTSVHVEQYQWFVTNGSDRSRVRWTSEQKQAPAGTVISDGVPFRSGTTTVFDVDGGTYQIGLRYWDRLDRVASPGDEPYREVWRTVTLTDAANPAPTGCTATQVGVTPLIDVRWQRTAAATRWVIVRDGKSLTTVEHADVTSRGSNDWSWIDRTAAPWAEHTYEVKAVEDGGSNAGQSPKSPTATVNPRVEGTWFLRANGQQFVVAAPEGVSGLELTERRATYSPPALTHDVYVYTAPSFLSGTVVGVIEADDDTGQDMRAAIAIAQELALRPEETVQLVSGTVSMPVRFSSGPKVLPIAGFFDRDQSHDFTCSVQQVGEYGEL